MPIQTACECVQRDFIHLFVPVTNKQCLLYLILLYKYHLISQLEKNKQSLFFLKKIVMHDLF